jgi:hypothetical protein
LYYCGWERGQNKNGIIPLSLNENLCS